MKFFFMCHSRSLASYFLNPVYRVFIAIPHTNRIIFKRLKTVNRTFPHIFRVIRIIVCHSFILLPKIAFCGTSRKLLNNPNKIINRQNKYAFKIFVMAITCVLKREWVSTKMDFKANTAMANKGLFVELSDKVLKLLFKWD